MPDLRAVFGKKQFVVFGNHRNHEQQENQGLYDFGIGVRVENFIARVGSQMKQHAYPNIASEFAVQPVHNQHKQENTGGIVNGSQRAFRDHMAVVIAFHKSQRQMPHHSIHAENHRSGKQAEFSQQRICAVTVPRQFFNQRGKSQHKPCGYKGGLERRLPRNMKLRPAISEKGGNHLRRHNGAVCQQQNQRDGKRRKMLAQGQAVFQIIP